MFLDFIEIGTSDFCTEIQKNNSKTGISIEPIKYYLDKLPNKDNVKKLNIAISNYDGEVDVFYVPENLIKKYSLPEWVKGCNTILDYHPTVRKHCEKKNLKIEDLSISYKVPVKRFKNVLIENNINGTYLWKIDTEGHDIVILNNFYDEVDDNKYLPHNIIFESNSLSKPQDVNKIINLYKNLGYDLIKRGHDTEMKLNLEKLKDKKSFTEKINDYHVNGYPKNYDPMNPPYNNDLASAIKFCKDNNYSCVTYVENRYEVRYGSYLSEKINVSSWIFI